MPIELRDLRWATVTAGHPSIRQAAEALNVRESTLSRRLRDLENRLGADLFERTANGTQLTAAGEEFIALAQHILAATDAAFARMKARGQGERGELVVGICSALSVGNLSVILAEHNRQHDGVEVRSVEGSRTALLTELASGGIEVFLSAASPSAWTDPSLPLWNEQIVVALPVGHRLCSKAVVRGADLARSRILVNRRDPGPDYETLLRGRLGDRCRCAFVGHDVSLDRLLGLVAAGLGLTLVSEGATTAIHSGITYRELHDDDGPVRIRFAAYWKETNRNPALRPFLDLLRERYSDTAPSFSSE